MATFELTQEWLKEHYDYNAETGELTRIKKDVNKSRIGFSAWPIDSNGYRKVVIKGKIYAVHRLIWLWMHGYFPPEMDHINHNRTDNRLSNLRKATRTQNSKNRSLRSDNTSGRVGISWQSSRKAWMAFINIDHKLTFLGRFKDFAAAVAAREEAESVNEYHPNHGR